MNFDALIDVRAMYAREMAVKLDSEIIAGGLAAPVRLNLGAGKTPIDGYDNSFDLSTNDKSAYPLAVPDNSVDEIRASHILEHFSHTASERVLKDWVRALKPGGLIKIAVPDLEYIAHAYVNGAELNYQGVLSGGHEDSNDVHLTQFDHNALEELMRDCGLVGVHFWRGHDDCSIHETSMNLAAWKRPEKWPSVAAVMSVPRLGFTDNRNAIDNALRPLGIPFATTQGAFWGQCLTRAIDEAMKTSAEWVLTLDYDTMFDRTTIENMLAFATLGGEQIDALAPIQMHRDAKRGPMMVPKNFAGEGACTIEMERLAENFLPLRTAHFGCTLLRVEALRKLPKPWFWSKPDANGGWGDGHTDDDIYFWQQWEAAGLNLHQANRVAIGHAELMVIWPDRELKPMYQNTHDYRNNGLPIKAWR